MADEELNEEGQSPAEAGEGESDLEALLSADPAELDRQAFGPTDEDEDGDPEESDEADGEEESEPEGDADTDEDDDESEETEVSVAFDPKTATAAEWAFELRTKPQRFSEIPKGLRPAVQRYQEEDRKLFRAAAAELFRQHTEAQKRTETLRELFEQGDMEAFRARAAEDPEAERLFYRQRFEAAEAQKPAPEPVDDSAGREAIQNVVAKVQANPQAWERFTEHAREEGWDRPQVATPQVVAEISAAAERFLAEKPSKASQRATQTTEAAKRRKSLPKANVSSGPSGGGRLSKDELLNKPLSELEQMAFSN